MLKIASVQFLVSFLSLTLKLEMLLDFSRRIKKNIINTPQTVICCY